MLKLLIYIESFNNLWFHYNYWNPTDISFHCNAMPTHTAKRTQYHSRNNWHNDTGPSLKDEKSNKAGLLNIRKGSHSGGRWWSWSHTCIRTSCYFSIFFRWAQRRIIWIMMLTFYKLGTSAETSGHWFKQIWSSALVHYYICCLSSLHWVRTNRLSSPTKNHSTSGESSQEKSRKQNHYITSDSHRHLSQKLKTPLQCHTGWNCSPGHLHLFFQRWFLDFIVP